MNDTLTTLGVLLLGVWAGVKLHEAWSVTPGPNPYAVQLPEGEPHRATMALCRCEKCAPPYLVPSPAEPV
jgi:hypothetical protein